jgi:predicted DNA-binding transcriptional regulator YafY
MGDHSEILKFLDELTAALPIEKRQFLKDPTLPIDLDLDQTIDPNGISERVWKTAWRAVKTRRKLTFNYLSPSYKDGNRVLHEVAPYRIQYQWGHWYLRAYRVLRRDLDGQEDRQGVHLRYRLTSVLDDEQLSVSPSVMHDPPGLPRYDVHYILLPPLSRGVISHHFDEMQFKNLDDGSVEVTGTSDDDWEAWRTLLAYGQYCVVLGGEEVLGWMERTVNGLFQNYSKMIKKTEE